MYSKMHHRSVVNCFTGILKECVQKLQTRTTRGQSHPEQQRILHIYPLTALIIIKDYIKYITIQF